MADKADFAAVNDFDISKLKKVGTVEKNSLPSAEDIAAEKAAGAGEVDPRCRAKPCKHYVDAL